MSMIMIDMYWYCSSHHRPFTVTDTVSTLKEDIKISRTHSTHRDGRAFDISVKGWSKKFRKQFCNHFNHKYEKEAAISASTLKRTLCIDHVGTAAHIHVQADRKFTVENLELPQELI